MKKIITLTVAIITFIISLIELTIAKTQIIFFSAELLFIAAGFMALIMKLQNKATLQPLPVNVKSYRKY
jgi:NADH:ubiquinone oxidoreductase subunit K